MMKTLGLLAFLWSVISSASQAAREQSHTIVHTSLNFSSAAPHIFASTFGLLQQWSNTFYPYGHSIVPCEIPVNTNLYHARIDGDMPPSPEWFAFDAAMSYAIAGVLDTSNLLTYRTTRNVKAIYFDGTSAALNGDGNMDSQMVMIWNNSANVPNDPIFGPGKPSNRTSGDPNGGMLGSEYDRADALCAYIRDKDLGGRGWGYEGIVRMNAGFEMIWCDFDSPSAKLVSHFNTSVPTFRDLDGSSDLSSKKESLKVEQDVAQQVMEGDVGPPHRREPVRRPFLASAQTGWLTASTNRYGFVGGMPGRGEVRAKADSCGIWSFYDPGLVDQEQARVVQESKTLNISRSGAWAAPTNESERSIALQKLSRRRRSHRADHISESDGHFMQKSIEERLRASLNPSENKCSGIDWHQISEEVVLEYSSDLQDLLSFLKGVPKDLGSNQTEDLAWIAPVRKLVHLMAMPYYTYPAVSDVRESVVKAFDFRAPESETAYERCRDQYTPVVEKGFASSELIISQALSEVLDSICRVVFATFLSIETVWFTSFEPPSPTFSIVDQDLAKTAMTWQHNIEELMAWLGWADQWTACNPGCGPSELCWIPMWPISFMIRPQGDNDGPPGPLEADMDEPQPGQGRPPPGRERPPYHGPGGRGPGYGYHRPPPGFGGHSDELLWKPQCVKRTQMLQG